MLYMNTSYKAEHNTNVTDQNTVKILPYWRNQILHQERQVSSLQLCCHYILQHRKGLREGELYAIACASLQYPRGQQRRRHLYHPKSKYTS